MATQQYMSRRAVLSGATLAAVVAPPSVASPGPSELMRLGAQWTDLIRRMESIVATLNQSEERAWAATPPRPFALACPIPARNRFDQRICAAWHAAHDRALAAEGYFSELSKLRANGAAIRRVESRISRLHAKTVPELALKARVAAQFEEGDDSDVMASLHRDLRLAA